MALNLWTHNNNYPTVPANCLVKMYSNTILAVCNSRMTGRIRGGREDTTLHSFDSFDMSIGGLNIELRDTETNRNADSSLRPEISQRSDDQEKAIGLNDRFFKHWFNGARVERKGQTLSPTSQADNLMPILYSQHEWHSVDGYHWYSYGFYTTVINITA